VGRFFANVGENLEFEQYEPREFLAQAGAAADAKAAGSAVA
jgi:hypothetical protein